MFARLAEFARSTLFLDVATLKVCALRKLQFFMILTTTMPKRCFVRILKGKLCSQRWRGGLQSEMAVFGSLLDTEMERGRESRSRVSKNISLYFHFHLSISAPVWEKNIFYFGSVSSQGESQGEFFNSPPDSQRGHNPRSKLLRSRVQVQFQT